MEKGQDDEEGGGEVEDKVAEGSNEAPGDEGSGTDEDDKDEFLKDLDEESDKLSQEAELEDEEPKPKKKRKVAAKCWDPKYHKKSKTEQAGHI